MSGLQKFIGSRDGGPDLPRPTCQSSSHAEGKKERLQAKAQELGYTDLEGSDLLTNSAFELPNASHPRRRIVADEHRVKVPVYSFRRDDASAKGFKSIGQSYDPSPGPVRAVHGLPEKQQEASYDPFDTDAESLEATATISDSTDLPGVRINSQGFMRSGNGLDHIYGGSYENWQSPPQVMGEPQRPPSPLSDQDDPKDLTEDEEEIEHGGSRDDGSAEAQPEHGTEYDDRSVEDLVVLETTQHPEYTIGFRSGRTAVPTFAKEIAESALGLHPISPRSGQETAHNHTDELLRMSVTPLAPELMDRSIFHEEPHQNERNRQRRLLGAALEQVQARPNETAHYDAPGKISLSKVSAPRECLQISHRFSERKDISSLVQSAQTFFRPLLPPHTEDPISLGNSPSLATVGAHSLETTNKLQDQNPEST